MYGINKIKLNYYSLSSSHEFAQIITNFYLDLGSTAHRSQFPVIEEYGIRNAECGRTNNE